MPATKQLISSDVMLPDPGGVQYGKMKEMRSGHTHEVCYKKLGQVTLTLRSDLLVLLFCALLLGVGLDHC